MKKEARTILVGVCLLIMLGIVMIYSSSGVYAHDKCGDSLYFIKKHLFFLAIGIMGAFYCMSVPAGRLRAYSKWILLFFILLLLVVLVPGVGVQAGGARRWIRFFGSGLQPSEFAKLGLIIYLADFCARKSYVMENARYGLIPPLLVTVFVGGLVLIEPDMGTFVALLFVGMIMLFVAGANIKHISYLIFAMLPVMVAAILLKPYRMNRILTVLHPEREAQGAGFQLMQSFISLGTGGLFGVGLGESKQKLYYLPESHTDFIFSIIGEELGFVGAALVLVIFVVVIWSLWRIATKMNEKFSALVVTGIAAMISFEVIVNVGVSTGVLPTKGLPLPFISYGGSSLVLHLAAIGLVLNMSKKAG